MGWSRARRAIGSAEGGEERSGGKGGEGDEEEASMARREKSLSLSLSLARPEACRGSARTRLKS